LFRETIHRLAISPLRETSRFACFAKNRNAKQTKRFAKHFRCFATQKSAVSSKTFVWWHEVNRSFSILKLFRERLSILLFREMFRNMS
jgi:hypothetical protein